MSLFLSDENRLGRANGGTEIALVTPVDSDRQWFKERVGLTPPGTARDLPLIGGHWRVVRELGRGTVGAVFEAHDRDGRRAAIKFLLPKWRGEEQALERFAREARVLMRLSSPHVGRLLDVGNLDLAHGDLPYLVLELLEGEDLLRLIQRSGPVPYRQALAFCADACLGVAEAHEVGVVHRDLKPSNIFLARTAQAGPLVKVLDFGLAAGDPSPSSGRLTSEYNILGSPSYMSPEQAIASGDADPRSDVWSMGVVLYELVTGHLPFAGQTFLQMLGAIMTRAPEPLRTHLPEDLPAEVEAIIGRCLEKDRARRYPSMNALRADLRAAAGAAGPRRQPFVRQAPAPAST